MGDCEVMAESDTNYLPAGGGAALPRGVVWLGVMGALGLLGWLGWQLQVERARSAARQESLVSVRLAHRAALAEESVGAGLQVKVARLEAEVARLRGEALAAAEARKGEAAAEAGKVAELERVMGFLREELGAAQQTIERLGQAEGAAGGAAAEGAVGPNR